ncbi:DUF6807 family protein [Dactylosporangium sp. NPDC049140]|uniref:DUF6807 family protein n=1 Tax=Dactylosporangium sp. NPDC049140 TaxID=3155647 RepID=UPI00340C21B7
MSLQVDHALGRSVTVSTGGGALLSYGYRPDTPRLESPKPYLHPIRTLAGEALACLNPAPFFSAELELAPGATVGFRYALVITAGEHGDEGTAALADHGRTAPARPGVV